MRLTIVRFPLREGGLSNPVVVDEDIKIDLRPGSVNRIAVYKDFDHAARCAVEGREPNALKGD